MLLLFEFLLQFGKRRHFCWITADLLLRRFSTSEFGTCLNQSRGVLLPCYGRT